MPFNWSFWEQQAFLGTFDVIVLGSGIVGLQSALALKAQSPRLRIAVVDRGPFPRGASTRNAGFACFGSVSELSEDREEHSLDGVIELVERRIAGLQRVRSQLGDEVLDYQPLGGYELFLHEDQDRYESCLAAMEELNLALRSLTGLEDTFTSADSSINTFGFANSKHLILNRGEGQLHPGKMMRGLVELAREAAIELLYGMNVTSLDVYEQSVSLTIDEQLPLKARWVLVATNGFSRQLLPDLEVRPVRNQVLLTEPIPDLDFAGTFHYDRGYVYFRNVGKRLLLGGGRHWGGTAEETDQAGFTASIQDRLEPLLREVILPESTVRITHRWSGILGVGEKKSPVVRMVAPRVGVAVRLGGMGVALGHLVGEEAAGMLNRAIQDEL